MDCGDDTFVYDDVVTYRRYMHGAVRTVIDIYRLTVTEMERVNKYIMLVMEIANLIVMARTCHFSVPKTFIYLHSHSFILANNSTGEELTDKLLQQVQHLGPLLDPLAVVLILPFPLN